MNLSVLASSPASYFTRYLPILSEISDNIVFWARSTLLDVPSGFVVVFFIRRNDVAPRFEAMHRNSKDEPGSMSVLSTSILTEGSTVTKWTDQQYKLECLTQMNIL